MHFSQFHAKTKVVRIFKIFISFLTLITFTTYAEDFKLKTHNWNNTSNTELLHQNNNNRQVEKTPKLKNTYKPNNEVTYNYHFKNVPKWRGGLKDNSVIKYDYAPNMNNPIPARDISIRKFKKNLRAINGSITSYNLKDNLNIGLIYAGKPFYLSLAPRHKTGAMKCKVDVDFGDGSKILNTNYKERFVFDVNRNSPHIYKSPGIYTITLDDELLLRSCNKYNLSLQVPVLNINKYIEKTYNSIPTPDNNKFKNFEVYILITIIVLILFYWFNILFSTERDKLGYRDILDRRATNIDCDNEVSNEAEYIKSEKILAASVMALRLQKPTIYAPQGYKVTDVKLTNKLLVEWSVCYVENSKPNVKKYFKASIGTKGMNVGGAGQFKLEWPSPL